jgi:hypothetical protein
VKKDWEKLPRQRGVCLRENAVVRSHPSNDRDPNPNCLQSTPYPSPDPANYGIKFPNCQNPVKPNCEFFYRKTKNLSTGNLFQKMQPNGRDGSPGKKDLVSRSRSMARFQG